MNLYTLRSTVAFGYAGQVVAIPTDLVDEAAGMVALGLAIYTDDPVSVTPVDPPSYVSHDALVDAIDLQLSAIPALNRGVHAVVTS